MVCRVGLASPLTAGYKHLFFSPPPLPPPPSLADSASQSCGRHHPTWSRFCLFVSALSINPSMPREPSPSPPPPAILSRHPRHLNTTQVVLRPASLPPRTQQAPRLACLHPRLRIPLYVLTCDLSVSLTSSSPTRGDAPPPAQASSLGSTDSCATPCAQVTEPCRSMLGLVSLVSRECLKTGSSRSRLCCCAGHCPSALAMITS